MLGQNIITSSLLPQDASSAIAKKDCIRELNCQPQSTIQKSYKNSSTTVNCLGINRSHLFAAQAEKSTVHVYNRQTGKQEATVPFQQRIHSLVVTSGRFPVIVLGTGNGSLILWETCTGRQITTAAAHLNAVTCLALTPDNNFIISGSSDSTAHVWSLERVLSFSRAWEEESELPAPTLTFGSHRSAITALVSPSSSSSTVVVFSASKDGTIHKWNALTGENLSTTFAAKAITCLAVDPAVRALYIAHEDGSITFQDLMVPLKAGLDSNSLIDLDMEKNNWTSPATLNDCINCSSLIYDGTLLLCGHQSGKISAWNIGQQAFFHTVTQDDYPVTNLHMLDPQALLNEPETCGQSIVKPKIEISQATASGRSSIIPSNYTLQAKINGAISFAREDANTLAMIENGWPDDITSEGSRIFGTAP